ncbi:sulfotransferase domain-containing protein [Pelagibius sp.]|uniref:sulfotransferase domain-containing protein n=1 Tax=Pelagibius sp. TaxID=1931238 RepID=UPI003B503E74
MGNASQYPLHKTIKKLLPKAASKYVDRRVKLHLCDAVVISYPKCGRTWLRAMLTLYFAKIYNTPRDVLFDFANIHRSDSRVPKIFFSHEADYKGSPDRISIDRRRLEAKKLIFLARDPRDVIVSLYAHRLRRDRNWDGPIKDFIASAEGGFATALRYFTLWSGFLEGHGDAVVVRYEDLHSDPQRTFQAVLSHLEQPIDHIALAETVEETQFAQLRHMESQGGFRSNRLNAGHIDDPQAFKVRRGVVGGFVEDLYPGLISQVSTMMDRELQGAFGYQAGSGD